MPEDANLDPSPSSTDPSSEPAPPNTQHPTPNTPHPHTHTPTHPHTPRLSRIDRLLLVVLALAAASGALQLAGMFPGYTVQPETNNLWFGADMPRVFGNMVSRESGHAQTTATHPVFSLVAWSCVAALRAALHLPPLLAVRLFGSGVAGLWVAGMFLLFRLVGLRRPEALLFTALSGVCAGACFWLPLPETFPLGSLAIVGALCVAAWDRRRPVPLYAWVLASAATLGVTTTNWMVGLLAAWFGRGWKQALAVSAAALLLVLGLWYAQSQTFTGVVLPTGDRKAGKFTRLPTPTRALTTTSVLFFHSVVAPAHYSLAQPEPGLLPNLRNTKSLPGSALPFGPLAALLWAGLFCLGAWGLRTVESHRTLAWVAGLALAGQWLLHLVFGEAAFLYAAHFVPLLMLVAAFGVLTSRRRLAVGLAAGLLLCAGINNAMQLGRALAFVRNVRVPPHPGPDLLNADLRGADLRPRDLRGAYLYLADLRGARAEGADLREAYLVKAQLDRADLRKARLSGTNFRDTDLGRVDLRDADLSHASLLRSRLGRAKLQGANLEKADLRGAGLGGAHLEATRLTGALYNSNTRWPKGFDPEAAGAVLDTLRSDRSPEDE